MRSCWTKCIALPFLLAILASCHGGSAGSVDTTPPNVPSNLTALSASSDSIYLAWSASTRDTAVAGYKIYRDGTYLVSTPTTTATDSGLNASTQYCYTVLAYDTAGNDSGKSSQVCAKTWTISTIDSSSGTVGIASSIAHDSNNKLHISYYDGTNDIVKYISNATGTWVSSTVGSNIGGVAGNISTSIAVDSTDTVHVSYGSYTQKKLIYATLSSGTWITSTVDSGTMRQTSIATDSNNKVHISYYDEDDSTFRYATNASGSWVITTIDTVIVSAGSSSIAADSTDKIHIGYVGPYSGPYYDLMYATNVSGSWIKSKIDATDRTSVVALARDSNDKIHISYEDAINGGLKYATNATGTWIMATIDSTPLTGFISAIAIDSNNKIHVAYSYFGSAAGSDLRYAEETDNGWMTSDLDSVGNAGFFCSITVDSNNKVHISYWDGIYTDQDLKYATNM